MPDPLKQQKTISYKTWVKESLVEGLRSAYQNHPDSTLQKTKVTIDFPFTATSYPSIVVRFFEREIYNAGVGHIELIESTTQPDRYNKYKHYIYKGDIAFELYTLSTLDRDLLSDSLVQILLMGDMTNYSRGFLRRILNPDPAQEPEVTKSHFLTLNTDRLQGSGETQSQAPWLPEDILVYQTGYRMGAFGEFYSLLEDDSPRGLVEYVEIYPYDDWHGDPVPNPDPEDNAEWQ